MIEAMATIAPITWRNRIVGYGTEAPDQLVANPKNWRVHPKHQQAALKGALDSLGWIQNVIVNQRTGFVVDGHARVALAIREDQPEVPVTYVDLSPEEEALALATLDPIAAMAGADKTLLEDLLADLDTNDAGLDRLLGDLAKDHGIDRGVTGLTDPDAVPDPPADPITQPGDLWRLGEHRLLCGDATKAEDVERVMAGERAVLMATDPPYLVDYDGMNHPSKRGEPDKNKDWSKRYGVKWNESGDDFSLWRDAFSVARDDALAPRAAWYVWHPDRNVLELATIANELNLLWHQTVIWKKNQPVLTRCVFMRAHESCLFGWIHGNKPDLASRDQATSVWEIDHDRRPGVETVHPTQKPVELFAIPIRIHTNPGDLVYEPFSGSGSQCIAAEQLGRRCYGLEIDPKYCDVIVNRWQQFTGQTAERIA